MKITAASSLWLPVLPNTHADLGLKAMVGLPPIPPISLSCLGTFPAGLTSIDVIHMWLMPQRLGHGLPFSWKFISFQIFYLHLTALIALIAAVSTEPASVNSCSSQPYVVMLFSSLLQTGAAVGRGEGSADRSSLSRVRSWLLPSEWDKHWAFSCTPAWFPWAFGSLGPHLVHRLSK